MLRLIFKSSLNSYWFRKKNIFFLFSLFPSVDVDFRFCRHCRSCLGLSPLENVKIKASKDFLSLTQTSSHAVAPLFITVRSLFSWRHTHLFRNVFSCPLLAHFIGVWRVEMPFERMWTSAEDLMCEIVRVFLLKTKLLAALHYERLQFKFFLTKSYGSSNLRRTGAPRYRGGEGG